MCLCHCVNEDHIWKTKIVPHLIKQWHILNCLFLGLVKELMH